MKKLIYSVFTLLALSLVITACGGDSYEKRLKKEKKAISNYLADNGIKVLYDYPSDHKFADNEFYKEGSTGVYFRVLQAGDTDNALETGDTEEVVLRFDSVSYLVAETSYIGNNYGGQVPMYFTYGITETYLNSDYNNYPAEFSFMSPACVLPLEKGLGSNAVVDIIVPFLNGSVSQRSSYEPLKFTRMTYTYYKKVKPETPETPEK